MATLKYYNVYIDGIDKCGKDTIDSYITLLGNFKYLNKSRGMLTMLAYTKKFNRKYSYDLNSMKQSIHVLIDVDEEDWRIRCKLTNEKPIVYADDVKLFNEAFEILKNNGYQVYRFNSSKQTPYTIAKTIIDILDELNNVTN